MKDDKGNLLCLRQAQVDSVSHSGDFQKWEKPAKLKGLELKIRHLRTNRHDKNHAGESSGVLQIGLALRACEPGPRLDLPHFDSQAFSSL